MASIVDQIKELTAKRQVLIDQLISSLQAEVEALNDLGYSYVLVEGGTAPARRKARKADAGAIRWSTSITRSLNYAKMNKLNKAQALDGVKLALTKLATKKGIELPAEVLAHAEQAVAEAIKGK